MKRLALIASLASLAGCASLVDPGPDHVPVSSLPFGASVYLDGRLVGTTPLTLEVSRRSDAVVTVYAEDHPPLSYWVPQVTNGWSYGNLLFGGLIGLIIDGVAWNGVKHSETPLVFHLASGVIEETEEPQKQEPPPTESELRRDESLDRWQDPRWK